MSIIAELRRRNVFRVAAAYAVVGWLLVEVSSVVLPTFEAPGWVMKVVTFIVLAGFPIALVFAWAFEITPEGLKREHEIDREASITRHTGRKLDFMIIGLLAIAVVFLVVDNYVLKDEPTAPALAADAVQDERQSIAVLPFVNMSADPENEYFSDGIAEELLNLLARLPELKVSSRTSSFYFKGKNIDIPTVAEHLGVTNILEGSVRRAGDRIRITAQLIDTESDSHLWSETYDRELEDIFAVQDEIARKIVQALKVTLTPGDEKALESTRTASVDAYDFYLRGRAYYVQTTKETTYKAIAMFNKAIEADPGYAMAYAWLANSYTNLFRAFESKKEHLERADALARKALELAPDLADAHVALGFTLTMEQKFAEAAERFETALQLNPRSNDAFYYYGVNAYHQGDLQRTAELWERAVEIDPADYRVWGLLPQVYRSLDRPDDEMEAYRNTATLMRRELEKDPDGVQNLVSLATAELGLGQRGKAIESANRIMALADDAVVFYNVACLYSLAGEKTKAIDALQRSHEAGLADPTWMEQDSDLDGVRDDPRYLALIERMKSGLN